MQQTEEQDHLIVYLVRHGRSTARDSDKRQSPDSPLGEEGLKQAKALAKRMAKEKIDVVISSKWDRAFQTAEIVSKKIGIKLETIEGVHEKEQNPNLYGADLASEVHQRYMDEVKKFGGDLDWKFDGQGESLRDLLKRAEKFKNHLISKHRRESVLVIGHGLFIRAFVILALLGDKYDDKTFYRVFTSLSCANTGISLLEFLPEKKHWELRYLNDHLHIR
jgi:broad specificity phosphatase PhoE